jgi:hypothetical protein
MDIVAPIATLTTPQTGMGSRKLQTRSPGQKFGAGLSRRCSAKGGQIMASVQCVKAEDRVEKSDMIENGHGLRLDSLPGTWLNTDSSTRGIVKVVTAVNGSGLTVRAFGAGDPDLIDWGEVAVDYIYSLSLSSREAAGFTARYHFDFAEIQLQANWNQGLLVLASFTSFKDGSDRSNYFSRDFFHRN